MSSCTRPWRYALLCASSLCLKIYGAEPRWCSAGSTKLSGGAIAGIAVGASAAVVATLALLCLLCAARRRRARPPADVEMLEPKSSAEKVAAAYAGPVLAFSHTLVDSPFCRSAWQGNQGRGVAG